MVGRRLKSALKAGKRETPCGALGAFKRLSITTWPFCLICLTGSQIYNYIVVEGSTRFDFAVIPKPMAIMERSGSRSRRTWRRFSISFAIFIAAWEASVSFSRSLLNLRFAIMAFDAENRAQVPYVSHQRQQTEAICCVVPKSFNIFLFFRTQQRLLLGPRILSHSSFTEFSSLFQVSQR